MKNLLALVAFVALAGVGLALQSGGVVQSGSAQGKAVAKAAPKTVSPADKAVIQAQLPSYPLATCPVSNEPLSANGGPVDVVHEGNLYRVCCDGCAKAVPRMAEKLRAKVVAGVIAEQKPGYPMAKCVVGNVPLDEKAQDVVVGTRLIRTCCAKCAKAAEEKPAGFLAKVDTALIEKQKATYPLKTCVVSGEPLDAMGGPVDKLYGVRLVRVCCDGCGRGFDRAPAKFLAKLDAASKTGKPLGAKNKVGGQTVNKGKAKVKGKGAGKGGK